jgi:ParB-like chromosome segregation protein Spo0J
MTPREKYQVMPELPQDEYEALKTDIAARGVMVAIELDEYGNTLDGHHRQRACRELGINDYPVVVRPGLTEAEKLTHARKANLLRRQLSREQRRTLIAEELRDNPERSNRQIAEALSVDHKTVGAARERLQSTGEIPQLAKTTGADGKARRRPHGRKSINIDAGDLEEEDEEALPAPGKFSQKELDDIWGGKGAISRLYRPTCAPYLS